MRIRRITISVAFAAGLATLPLSTAEAQSNPPQSNPPQSNPSQYYPPCSPFPLEWPFCVVGAVLDITATIVTAPIRLLTGAPPFGYYGLLRTAALLPTAALSPTTGVLPAAELFWATLSPPVSRRWHSGDRSGGEIVSG